MRDIECHLDLIAAFQAMAAAAERRGWTEREVSRALLALVAARLVAFEGTAHAKTAVLNAGASIA